MNRFGLVCTALVLACPLYAQPWGGYDAARIPLVLGLIAVLWAGQFLRAARGRARPQGPAPLRTAGFILLGAHLLSLAAARSAADGAVPILILFSGLSVFSCLRGGLVARGSVSSVVPLLSAVALGYAGIGVAQKLCGMEAVSTEGNRNYAGALAAMFLPPTVAFTQRGRPWSRILAGVAAVALGILLLATESRGGLVAATAGLMLSGIALWAKRAGRGARASAVALVALVGLAAGLQGRHQLSPERAQTVDFRLEVWKSGARMVEARPFLGWGSGGFATEYPQFRSESEFQYSHKYASDAFMELEDAHSSWVQTAVETGVVGLLALVLVAYVAARLARYYIRVAADPGNVALLAGLSGGAAAYLVAGLFNSLTLKASPTVMFWAFLGLIELAGDARPWREGSKVREWRVALPAAASVVAFFGALWAGALGLADIAFTGAMSTKSAVLRERLLREALETNPRSWRAHHELAMTLSAVGRFQGAADEGRATLQLRPHNVEALNHTAICALQAQASAGEAEGLLRRAIGLAPYYYRPYHNLGVLEIRRGNRDAARRLFQLSIDHNPSYGASYYYRGLLSLQGAESEAAREDFRKARDLGFDVATALRTEHPAAEKDAGFSEFFR